MRSITWMAEEEVVASVRLEPVLVLLVLALASWLFYKAFLRNVSAERHRIFSDHFQNLLGHLSIGLVLFGHYEFLDWISEKATWALRLQPYVGFLAVLWGCIVLVKILRIIAYEYLFFTSMRAGVPLLLVNVFTLVMSLIAGGWILTKFFAVDLTPLLATSAIISIVLGLALQDTLGNLFAAIALQIDKPFELGDWIELKNGSDRIAGQVLEISWRATVLLAITDEVIHIPNRNMAQWQILNFAAKQRSFIRSHVFRIHHAESVEKAKQVLLQTMRSIHGVLPDPAPVVIVTETTDSWIALKAVYNILDYGLQYGIADRFLTKAIEDLRTAGVELATPRLAVAHDESQRFGESKAEM